MAKLSNVTCSFQKGAATKAPPIKKVISKSFEVLLISFDLNLLQMFGRHKQKNSQIGGLIVIYQFTMRRVFRKQ